MDIEFHYYMTYLIAARAGFAPADAAIIAHAAQAVDDNHVIYTVNGAASGPYRSYISQSMDILKARKSLNRIYPIYHFIPGVPDSPTARRKDGKTDPWVTTPDSPLANKMIDAALASGDLYRIGVSSHGYVDTWAHQNFMGRKDGYNDLPGTGLLGFLLNVGHGSAEHMPDWPGLVWTDPRLVDEVVDNRVRFLDAAAALFTKFLGHVDPTHPAVDLAAAIHSLRADLDADIGPRDDSDVMSDVRIARYKARALTAPYGATPIPDYEEYAWFNAAVLEEGATLRQKFDGLLGMFDDYVDQSDDVPCTWISPADYQTTDWYRFQMAVTDHQNACWQFLVDEQLPGLNDPKL